MQVIKTPVGLVKVDDPVKKVTQAQYDELSDDEKKTGTYYIKDDEEVTE